MSEATVLLGVAAAAGFAGSVHCAAMCGGIASIGAAAARAPSRPLAAAVLFHGARILSYAALGALLAGGAGAAMAVLPGAMEAAGRLLAATFMAALAVRILANRDVLGLEQLGARLFRRAAPLWSVLLRAPGGWRHAALGVLWGFMPCGLVYSMLAVAGANGRPLLAAAMMALFGLGTVPALIAITLGAARLGPALPRDRVRVLSGAVVLGCALWTAVGGLVHLSHHHPVHGDLTLQVPPNPSREYRLARAPVVPSIAGGGEAWLLADARRLGP